ncbi:hypothetical protein F7725_023293 [Dissostichus mawsoni]|uniref:Uncharacterized protein n=1 Tax=Dissostichus mawsoni TaxID=36200 RepID=A0A7J5Z4K0_DISMA|nr:hypothetical protein F7725_023293 [Dissostichus mawsoni]
MGDLLRKDFEVAVQANLQKVLICDTEQHLEGKHGAGGYRYRKAEQSFLSYLQRSVVENVILTVIRTSDNLDFTNFGRFIKDYDKEVSCGRWLPPEVLVHSAVSLGGVVVFKDVDVCVKAGRRVVRNVYGVFLEVVVLQLVLRSFVGGVVAHVLEQRGLEADHVLLGQQTPEVDEQPVAGHLLVEHEQEVSQAGQVSGVVQLPDVAQLGELQHHPVGPFSGGDHLLQPRQEVPGAAHVVLQHHVEVRQVGAEVEEESVVHVLLGTEPDAVLRVVVVPLQPVQRGVVLLRGLDHQQASRYDVVSKLPGDLLHQVLTPGQVKVCQVDHHHDLFQLLVAGLIEDGFDRLQERLRKRRKVMRKPRKGMVERFLRHLILSRDFHTSLMMNTLSLGSA